MPRPAFDTLILGQGLAGSALAWRLVHAGQRVCVIDDGHRSAASKVAAGLVNPLAGLRFTRRPETGDWLAAADAWYAELAHHFGRRFFHAVPMLRLLRSAEQRRFYEQRCADPASRELLGEGFAADRCPEPVSAPFGGFTQRRTGYVDLPALLLTLRDWLHRNRALVEAELAPGQIGHDADGAHALGLTGHRLVFCDGARLRDNPWFDTLPLRPEKGEILDIQLDDWRPRHVVNGAHWLVPLTGGGLRLGATHDHRRFDDQVTDSGRAELLAGLQAWRPGAPAPRVVRQVAGIRPGTADRYPLIGRHAQHPALWVFNGFGARGSLVIPWYAQCLARHWLHDAALPPEADIRRFA